MTKGKKTQEGKELKLFGYTKDVLVYQGCVWTMTVLKYTTLWRGKQMSFVVIRWYVVGITVDPISNDPILLLLDNSDSPSIVEQ